MGRRVLVTGGSGFLGGHVIPLLIARGDDVTALARTAVAAERVSELGATAVPGDLDDPASTDQAFAASGADALVNLASLGFGHAPAITAAAEEAGIERAVFLSTTAIFTTLDAASKQARVSGEEVIRSSRLHWTILRPTMIYGTPQDRNMARLLSMLRRTTAVPVPGGGHRLQQPVHVDDLAEVVVAALDTPSAIGRAYDLAGPDALALRQLIQQAGEAMGRTVRPVPVPLAPSVAALRLYERISARPRLKAEQLARLAEDKAVDISPARADLGFEPRPFRSGISQEAAMLPERLSGLDRTLLLARTVRHLQPAQLAHRARLRAQRAALARSPQALTARLARPLPAEPGWPKGFVPLDGRLVTGFPDAEANAKGHFRFLDEERDLGQPLDWAQAPAAHLWRYHLHYFEWAWSFVDHPDRDWARAKLTRLWRSWRDDATFQQRDAWSPYVASLRAWALCGVFEALVAGTRHATEFLDDLAFHAGFVSANLELDVGGNHLFKNLKALVGLGVFLHDEELLDQGVRRLERQLHTQVLGDGGHFERSPSYHCQVLADLIDVAELLEADGRPVPAALGEALAGMRGWLGAMRMPDGDLPLFNDCVRVGSDRVELLGPIASDQSLTVLEPSGYVVVRPSERLHLVADVGPPCPPALPAHAHADCLSFELAIGGRRVVTSAGTSTYEPGPQRAFERSTAAHSTVAVDGQDQTEVWATFRAARRANAVLERAEVDAGTTVVSASHDGYRRLAGSPRHRRTWRIDDDGLEIVDEVTGTGRHRVEAFLHLLGGASSMGDRVTTTQANIAFGGDGAEVDVRPSLPAEGFGRCRPGHVVRASAEGDLPMSLLTHFTIQDHPAEAGA